MTIERRLRKFFRGRSPQARREFASYRRRLGSAPVARDRGTVHPYWILLPRWLDRKYRQEGRSRPPGRTFLADMLWGQYCLYLFVRIRDDLFDRQAKSRSLRVIADQFLLEAEQTLFRWMPDHPRFWRICRSHVRTTFESILRADRLQRSPRTSPQQLVQAYAGVNAIFKIGALAVCTRYDRLRDMKMIERFADKIAVGSQLLDDLRDLQEDLIRGRLNYAARTILQANGRTGPPRNRGLQDIARRLLLSNAADELLGEIANLFSEGYKALEPLQLAEAGPVCRRRLQSLNRMRQEIVRRRAELLLRAGPRPRKG